MKKALFILSFSVLLIACSEAPPPSIALTGITLKRHQVVLEKGESKLFEVVFEPSDATDKTVEWDLSNPDVAAISDGVVTGVYPGTTEVIVRSGNLEDRCRLEVIYTATKLSLNKRTIEFQNPGESEQLTMQVAPEDAAAFVVWSSTNNRVATVKDGLVTAIAPGTAVIIAQAGYTEAYCSIKVVTPFVIQAIDLGLSVKWGQANLGATSTRDTGDFYAWAEIEPYYTEGHRYDESFTSIWKGVKYGYNWSSYQWSKDEETKLLKYCPENKADYWGGTGPPDNELTILPADDAARAVLGDSWRIPTKEEWNELINNCSWQTGSDGCLVTAPNGNQIYLPSTGYRAWTNYEQGWTLYWTSSLNAELPAYAYFVSSNGDRAYVGSYGFWRYCGMAIRPVTDQEP